MVWNESRLPFIRPVRNILALFNNKPLDVQFAGVRSGNKVPGHLLLSDAFFEVNSFREYIEGLSKNFVILREEERKSKILAEILDVEEELDCKVRCDDEMLDYYVYSNEYPVVFSGSFDAKYLGLPTEIITAFMTHEKKLLPVSTRPERSPPISSAWPISPTRTRRSAAAMKKWSRPPSRTRSSSGTWTARKIFSP